MKTRITLEPVREIDAGRRQFEQILEDLTPAHPDRYLPRRREMGRVWEPAIELQNTETAFILRLELPGIDAKDVDVQVSRSGVAIAGERHCLQRNQNGRHLGSELRYGKFHRVVQLPKPVLPEQVKAELKNGILSLTLPKLETVQPKVVKISVGIPPTAVKNDAAPVQNTANIEPIQSEPGIPLSEPELTEDLWATTA